MDADTNREVELHGGEGSSTGQITSSAPEQARSGRRQRKDARRYGFACSNCKSRKVKCSGEQPTCSACKRSGATCRWQSTSTEKELQRATERISHLQEALQKANDETQTRSRTSGPMSNHEVGPSPGSLYSSPTVNGALTQGSALWFQVGRGDDGSVVYNGPTSRFHVESLDDEMGDESTQQPSRERTPGGTTTRNVAHAEALAFQYSLLNNVWASLLPSSSRFEQLGVDSKTCMTLLDIYWTWLQPLHNIVYQPSFLMDMSLGGRYYSDFLLMCIMSLAARHLPKHDIILNNVPSGDQFVTLAKKLLFLEMDAPKPRIPTIQGLLILGGRQCAMGKSSEGWLYTGMALRMLVDIGMHLHIPDSKLIELERLTPVEIETRKRIYNSAYLWDKTISLALGRPPTLTQQPYSPEEISDHSDNLREWKPVHTPEIGDQYVPVPSYNTMTFCAHVSLHQITTEMMLLFSHLSREQSFTEEIELLHSKFDDWYSNLPEPLKIEDSGTSMVQSPPPHIVSLNILYHALYILLYRPSLGSKDPVNGPRAIQVCTTNSKRIMAIIASYERTFPYRFMTYQLSYCVFMAATVEAYVIKHSDVDVANEAAQTLSAAMRVLYNEAKHTPGISRSLDTIRRQLATWRLKGRPYEAPTSRTMTQVQPYPQDIMNRSQETGQHDVTISNLSAMGDMDGASSINNTQIPYQSQQMPSTVFGDTYNGAPLSGIQSDFSIGDFDTGAGFHPDAFPWSLADMSYFHGE